MEKNKDAKNMCSTIRFRVYINVLCCNMHVQHPQEERNICYLCYADASYATTGKLCTCKDLVLLETSISEFNEK